MPDITAFFSQFAPYHPNPRRSKQGTTKGTTVDLEEDGTNPAIVLDQILAVPETQKRFVTLAQNLLPFIEEVNVSRSPDHAPQGWTSRPRPSPTAKSHC